MAPFKSCRGGCGALIRRWQDYCPKCAPPDLFTPPLPEKVQTKPPKRTRASMPDAALTPPSAPGSTTSAQSAGATAPTFARTLDLVLAHITSVGSAGASRSEIARALDLRIQSVCSSVSALLVKGVVGENPDTTVYDEGSKRYVQIVHSEEFVTRWRDATGALIPRRSRSMLDGKPCDPP